MAKLAGYKTAVKKTGTSTTFASAAFTEIVNNKVFQITDTAKCLWDINPSIAFVFYENSVAINNADIDYLDMLQGIVAFKTANKTGTITGDGKYLPSVEVASTFSAELGLSNAIVDATTFKSAKDNGGYGSKAVTTKDATLSIENFYETDATFWDLYTSGSDILIEMSLDGTPYSRAYYKNESINHKSNLDDLIKEGISLVANDKTFLASAGYLKKANLILL
jgi:hypothetical protein